MPILNNCQLKKYQLITDIKPIYSIYTIIDILDYTRKIKNDLIDLNK